MTKVTVTLQYETVEEAIVGLGNVLAGDGAETPQKPKVDVGAAAAEAGKAVSAREPSKAVQELLDKHGLKAEDVPGSGKDGRVTKKDVEDYLAKQKPDTGEDEDVPGEPEPGEEEGGGGEYTLDDARAALKKVSDAKNIDVCRDVMSRFGVNRISDLKPDQFKDFCEKCEAVAKGEEV